MQTFLDEIWGVTPHHVTRACAGYFDRLGVSSVDALLAHVQPDPSTVRLVKGGEDKAPDTYRFADGSLDLARVRQDFADGYTIVVNRVERYVRALASLSHSIEVELNFPTQVNAYLTPPESTGFDIHYDPHDVLVLQIQGSKIWHVSNDAAVPPHEMQRRAGVVPDGLPSTTGLRLQAGDVLYLPRGQGHAAETTSELSVHLTLGLHAPTVLTLLTQVLHGLSFSDDRVHRRLPPRHLDDADVRASLGDLVREAARAVGDPSAIADGVGALEDVLAQRGRCPSVGPISDTVGIGEDTLVVKYQPLYARVVVVADGVVLQFAQLFVRNGPDHEAAMLFLTRGTEPFRIRDLPGLGAAQQIELARTLIATGFLVRLPDA